MKAIGNIYLIWRKGRGSRRISVGIIRLNATEGARFSYLEQGVLKAKEQGFTCYDSFPDTDPKKFTRTTYLKFLGRD